jgi:glycosyltransferase involved in cell wall biosynthesis
MEDSSVSVIIPCYNEGKTIVRIIDEIKKSSLVSEIIVIDDHSEAETKKILSTISDIKLITSSQNEGKSRTLKKGVLEADSKILAFIDGDLLNFTMSDLESLILPVVNRQCDGTISSRGKEAIHGKISGYAIAFTGERVFYKNILVQNMDIFDHPGYLFEAAFNKRFFGRLKIRGVFLKNLGQNAQIHKRGYVGFIADLKQLLGYIKFLGIKEFIKQLSYVKSPSFAI